MGLHMKEPKDYLYDPLPRALHYLAPVSTSFRFRVPRILSLCFAVAFTLNAECRLLSAAFCVAVLFS